MDRRDFFAAGLALSGGALALGADRARAATVSAPQSSDAGFPSDFLWGCATAAYQIEGAVNADGRGQTNWDVFSHTPGKTFNGDSGDVACDSYNRFAEDTQLIKALGAKTYRLSLAWARIFPEGRGRPNQKGVDHYKRVVDNLLENGIQPCVTMFHWDLPTALEGGWRSRDTAYAFADYAGYMAGQLGDRVGKLMTTNEIRCFTDLGHKVGIHAPGLQLGDAEVNQVRHHGVLAHGLALAAMRGAVGSDVQIGLAENPNLYAPVVETPEHIEAAKKAMRDDNAMFLTAIMEGRYLDSYLEEAGAAAPTVQDGDMAIIGAPVDFVGINVYTTGYARADGSARGYAMVPRQSSSPHMASPWLFVTPEAGSWAVRQISELWNPRGIYITENGCSSDDTMVDGRVDDIDRVMYLRNYMTHLHRAVREGLPLKGYFLWSLMDNFEWADGYAKRFGIHYVDFATQRRTPKLSAEWYRHLIAANALV